MITDRANRIRMIGAYNLGALRANKVCSETFEQMVDEISRLKRECDRLREERDDARRESQDSRLVVKQMREYVEVSKAMAQKATGGIVSH